MRFLAPNWNLIYDGLTNVALKLKNGGEEFDAIVGIARGGWIPARILSDFLGVKRLISMQVSSYKDLTKNEVKSWDVYQPAASERRVLIVDDVADTGSSLIKIKNELADRGVVCKTATIYVKPWANYRPDYYYKEVTEWIVFPWEVVETVGVRLNQGVSSYDEAVQEIGLDPHLHVIVRPFLGELYGDKNRLKKI
ncbi:MAG: phosphoribosyltransferase [Thermoprotei archaeon]